MEENKDASVGQLQALVRRGLPNYINNRGGLNVPLLGRNLNLTYQAVYLIFKRNSIAKVRIKQICELSQNTPAELRPATMIRDGVEVPWEPLTLEDFMPFMK